MYTPRQHTFYKRNQEVLEGGTSYVLKVFAANTKGASSRRELHGYTLRDVAERRTAQVGYIIIQENSE